MQATVIRSTGSFYTVMTTDGGEAECKLKGNFRLRGIRSTNPVAVGDVVDIEPGRDGTTYITAVHDRRNYIIRKSPNLSKQSHILAANIDLVLLLATLHSPETSTTFIDRFLASAEAYRVPVALVLNKTDLLTADERGQAQRLLQIYADMGYTTLQLSATNDHCTPLLEPLLKGKRTLLAGHSGVGKSTLLNQLVPGADTKTAAISKAHHTGQHATTYSRLYPLPFGGSLIDIPGIKGFGTFNISPQELTGYFRDIFSLSHSCRFNNCTHTHEPGCAVRKALEEHRLAPSRYASYLNMLDDQAEAKYREAY